MRNKTDSGAPIAPRHHSVSRSICSSTILRVQDKDGMINKADGKAGVWRYKKAREEECTLVVDRGVQGIVRSTCMLVGYW